MSHISTNPRVAWAMAYESGIRTQAAADLQEAGCKVQTSGAMSGGCYGEDYTPVYSAIRCMEREAPVIAAVGHWLCLADEGAANQYLDDVHDTVLTRLIVATPEWSSYRKARRERIEALVQARMVQERNDMDGSRPSWGPAVICGYVAAWLGVNIVEHHWQRDGWEHAWREIGEIIRDLESEAMSPIADVARQTNRVMREAA